jgi:hypothetical protein
MPCPPRYAVLSNLLSFHPSSVQTTSSAHCSQICSAYVFPLMSETKFTPIQNHRQNYSFVYFNFYLFRHILQAKVLKTIVASIKPGIDCAQLPRAAVHVRQTRSFVYALITVFVSSIEARQQRAAVDRRCSSVLANAGTP